MTLGSIDEKLIVLDGKAYQDQGSRDKPEVIKVHPDAEKVPYVAVIFHQAEVIFKQHFEMSREELQKRIETYYDGENLFCSIKDSWSFCQDACLHDSQIS